MITPRDRREYIHTKAKLYSILLKFDESELSDNETNLMTILMEDSDIQAILENALSRTSKS